MAFRHAPNTDDPLAGLWELRGRIVKRTQKAILFDDGERSVWLPASKIRLVEGRGEAVVGLPDWLAKEKGIA